VQYWTRRSQTENIRSLNLTAVKLNTVEVTELLSLQKLSKVGVICSTRLELTDAMYIECVCMCVCICVCVCVCVCEYTIVYLFLLHYYYY
jgi:hypothetical protein